MSDGFRFVPFHQLEQRPSVPFSAQASAFDRYAELILDLLAARLADPAFRREVLRLASARLCDGYRAYGDAACHWGPEEVERNMLEEIADYVVYGCIGGIGREGARR